MKRILSLAIFLLMIFGMNVIYAAGGTCGNNVNWNLDDTGVMTISGNGKMTDYLIEDVNDDHYGWFNYTPWQGLNGAITEVIINDGVTGIGSHSFADCKNLRKVQLGSSINYIGSEAFKDCSNLETINNIPNNLIVFGKDVFSGCGNLKSGKFTAADFGSTAAVSSNINSNEYTRWSKPVNSYLYVDGEDLVRVENVGGQIIVEKYNSTFEIISSKRLDSDIADLWGGFFAGKNENYIITGKVNNAESNAAEVIRISKYSKDWNLIDQAVINGSNTRVPFDAGSLRCVESDGILYILTCHKMYRSNDGMNHQSNMLISIRESDMEIADINYQVSNTDTGYVSHSFNQFILIDDDKNIVTLNHGDAFPRAVILMKYRHKADTSGKFNNGADNVLLLQMNGYNGDNSTGTCVGGLAETQNHYVTAFNYDGIGGNPNDYHSIVTKRDLYVSFTLKNNLNTKQMSLSPSNDDFSIGTPAIAPVDLSSGYILWNEMTLNNKKYTPNGVFCYVKYDDEGNLTTTQSVNGSLSDCQPIIYNGKITWYVTDNTKPTFYILDDSGLNVHSQA